jgi:hypothetical protein
MLLYCRQDWVRVVEAWVYSKLSSLQFKGTEEQTIVALVKVPLKDLKVWILVSTSTGFLCVHHHQPGDGDAFR